eukprot:TRINITY_DN11952_c0_g1::TRINITY_DN11952_c0_g1_i1::g.16984::m.16984 TRINITY_DN11952_c0_g1::TRINITY_DN11952_c0_g1_i1::g.16984  ORF type:complete len:258 (+),score=6.72,sp/Q3T0Q6/CNBP_BOVIN/41.74/3e-18,sp/Q3T0Q6/CNBP_BOVIN/37.17/4e-17,sp/Q3T0Q6/CNBP_BOVIN/37.27/7e-17,sp/Q3T0Q6/CNBP_BOVIN/31.91/3e-07,zf-CCHC/PF00098.18/4e-07,zf-CCHC/PF00098.18/3e-09,zf-CCHC/PF00098.18/1.9e-07,zf-CCHC/PF00098.18/9.2e-08,zf-CCHC_5/PF14787.1/3e+03,zf-CCHC_5/PF14787.1/0.014,zf-CCHC_5/PF14787.1/0.026,zf-CCHC_5/PF14787.1/0
MYSGMYADREEVKRGRGFRQATNNTFATDLRSRITKKQNMTALSTRMGKPVRGITKGIRLGSNAPRVRARIVSPQKQQQTITIVRTVPVDAPVVRRRATRAPAVKRVIQTQQFVEEPVVCFSCGKKGHLARECRSAIPQQQVVVVNDACYNCGKPGHLARDCRSAITQQIVVDDSCFNCGRKGHLARDCRSNPRSNIQQVVVTENTENCFNCGKKGHLARDCRALGGGGRCPW